MLLFPHPLLLPPPSQAACVTKPIYATNHYIFTNNSSFKSHTPQVLYVRASAHWSSSPLGSYSGVTDVACPRCFPLCQLSFLHKAVSMELPVGFHQQRAFY